jgi:hypothetical protein
MGCDGIGADDGNIGEAGIGPEDIHRAERMRRTRPEAMASVENQR